MKAVIMAGGKGTRLAEITKNEIPKPMVPVEGKPLLEWQIERLKEYEITEITMIIGFLGDKVSGYFGDGSRFGVKIDYIKENEPLGTAGALYYLRERMKNEDFMLIFGDIFFDFDISRMVGFHKAKNAEVTLMAHPNAHPFDSDLIRTDHDGRVIAFDSKHNVRDYWYDNCVNAGIYVLNGRFLSRIAAPVKTDFEKDILAPMALEGGALYAYRTPEYVMDVGTVDRINKATADLRSGMVEDKNLRNKQKAFILDRDGVINVAKGFLYNIDDFELIPCAAEAIKLINSSGYLAVVASNQPVIARGECTVEELEEIFNKMKTLLGKEGAYLDECYYCPHHPHKGYEGERPEYKIDCECRKPKIGMALKAQERFNLDLSQSWVIGDRTKDIEMGRRAGCRTALVMTGEAGTDGEYDKTSDIVGDDLLDAVRQILAQ